MSTIDPVDRGQFVRMNQLRQLELERRITALHQVSAQSFLHDQSLTWYLLEHAIVRIVCRYRLLGPSDLEHPRHPESHVPVSQLDLYCGRERRPLHPWIRTSARGGACPSQRPSNAVASPDPRRLASPRSRFS